jgi:hypothetical protein
VIYSSRVTTNDPNQSVSTLVGVIFMSGYLTDTSGLSGRLLMVDACVHNGPMTTSECEHDSGFCDHGRQQSGCGECGHIRPRCDCGEWDGATHALDRLNVMIHPAHPMQSPERQWRIIAAEMAMLLTDDQLTVIREQHTARAFAYIQNENGTYWAGGPVTTAP